MATLGKCLQSIRNQTLQPLEIIVIDSASEDESVAIAIKFGSKIISINPKEFDHGLTRNLGVQNATGDLIFMTVQDARLGESDLLERMVKHFSDHEVMGVTGHQAVPHEKDKNPVMWYQRHSDFTIDARQINDTEAFLKLPQNEQSKLIAWDNVIAMYRRRALIDLPFVQTKMSEDWLWSFQALQKSWKLIRDSSLIVYHYHHLTPKYVFKNNWSVNYHFYKFFGFKPSLPRVVKPVVQVAYHILKNKQLNHQEKLYWFWHNLKVICVRWLANFSFLYRLKVLGIKRVERGYKKYCKNIPQGKQMCS